MANKKAVELSAATTDQLDAGLKAAMLRVQKVNLSVENTLVFEIAEAEWDNWDKSEECAIVADKDECDSDLEIFSNALMAA